MDRADFRKWLDRLIADTELDRDSLSRVPIRYPLFAYLLYRDMYSTTVDIRNGTFVQYIYDNVPIAEYILLLSDSLETLDVSSEQSLIDARLYLSELDKRYIHHSRYRGQAESWTSRYCSTRQTT